jgi:predicted P-loop ATPase
MISAVARIFQPGCKADCCLIFEGKQGRGKSTVVKILSDPWFTDEISELGGREAAIQTAGVWIVELAELASMNRAHVNNIKAFMSRSADRFRRPWGRHAEEFPRQCVFAGTTNKDAYFSDETGNRRFWPVACGPLNLDGIRADRDQLCTTRRSRTRISVLPLGQATL